MGNPNADDQITFVAYQQPALESADYKLKLKQKVSVANKEFSTERTFTVGGERFNLPSSLVRAVFPPDGSTGDHSHVLPHILLNRSSLPWERKPYETEEISPRPWLALLLFDSSEELLTQVVELSNLTSENTDTLLAQKIYFPPITKARLQKNEDLVTVIDIRKSLLQAILPKYTDLDFLAHIRSDNANGKDYVAAIIGNRLPRAGGVSIVHLVSLENRYHPNPQNPSEIIFDFGNDSQIEKIRLVSLANWRFACIEENKTFSALVHTLTSVDSTQELSTTGNPTLQSFLSRGYTPVRHLLRQGGQSIAWYRGPFTPSRIIDRIDTPVRSSDSLLRYHRDTATFDVSYSACWELGRLLALQSSSFSTALFDWKQRRKQQKHKHDPTERPPKYSLKSVAVNDDIPDGVRQWLADLGLLQGVPFKYLMPNEQFLPEESINIFWVDLNWILCLLDGAYSIGRVTDDDLNEDKFHPPPVSAALMSGVLIRSEVVNAYPGLMIAAYADQDGNDSLERLRFDRLTPNILLCLFKGEIGRLDIHQQPETMHFVVEVIAEGSELKVRKSVRDKFVTVDIDPEIQVIDIKNLASKIQTELSTGTFESSDFAIEMLETAERVTFKRATNPSPPSGHG
jgi:hypothetical protein